MLNSTTITGILLDDGWANGKSAFMKLKIGNDFIITLRMSYQVREKLLSYVGKEICIIGSLGKVRHYDNKTQKMLYDIAIWVKYVEENENDL